uniref:ABC transporter domain-containing protein n=1 Tax=Kalanchoe fedtschenkoi TaxID=63787 RepID=A0A7N0V0C7_KALFE
MGSRAHSRTTQRAIEDEEALKWAAIEKLPTYDRLRTSIMETFTEHNGNIRQGIVHKEVDVTKLDTKERQQFIEKMFKVAEEDNEKYLKKFRNRIDKVGIELPTIEVRFRNLTVEADCFVGSRALPTLPNVTMNIAEMFLGLLGIQLAKKTKITILKDAYGMVKPSRMALLLGPPSSGKTTLLLALAGKLAPELKFTGEIIYNGHKLNEFIPQKTSAYISQKDVHIAQMTVKETLDFSARCQGVGSRYELLAELARREKDAGIFPDPEIDLFMKATAVEGVENNLITDYTLKILGLDICKDTIVGDMMIRGVSGGQRKRVTTGEMIVGPTKVLFMDEISTGLDSSTTFQIVKCLQQIVHYTEATILVSLLQPAPETFDLFDDIIFISEGQIVYQGPREYALEFFESCGFRCPDRKGTADFLQEVTSKKDQQQYWADKSRPYRYIPVSEFASSFKNFHVGQQLIADLAIPYDKSKSHKASLVYSKYTVPKMRLLQACFDREVLLIKRNSFIYIFKTSQIFLVAIITSTVFLRTRMHTRNESDGSLYVGALLFSLTTNMFNSFAEMAMTIRRLPVLYKQRDLFFFPVWTFTLPNWLLSFPMTIIDSTIFVGVTYYSVGLAPEASRFFKNLLLVFLIQQMGGGLFRLIAGICRTDTVANTGGSLTLLLLFLLGGFTIVRGDIPDWWIWGYWCSPLMYGFNALAVNELYAPRWMNKLGSDNVTKLGDAVLEIFDVFHNENWYWIGAGVLAICTVLFQSLFTLSLMYLNPIEATQALIPEETENGQAVVRNQNGKPRATAEVVNPRRGNTLPFTPLVMSFENLSYSVDMPPEMKEQGVTEDKLRLLREITSSFRPGVLTALMGVSGAGKTTLMDVLAGRKTGGYIEGDIKINGYPKKQETFARISGYCEQNDIHSPQVTVLESLVYSAFLRLPAEVSREEKLAFVKEVMDLVELNNLKDAIVGLPGVSGLSTEQRKRLTIAVELVANPSIIFMDEPTSGLDARAAAIVMRTVRNTVDTGRTVVCTIHQPSIDIFEAFDELLLLKRGGQTIYSGPVGRNSQELIRYFEAIPGVPKMKEKYNPATYMLEASSVAAEHHLGIDFAEYYRNTPMYQQNKALVKELSTPPPGVEDLHFPTKYSQSTLDQFKICLWKQWWIYWRSPDYNLVRFFFTLATALVLGSVFWNAGTKRDTSANLNMVLGSMFAAVMFLGVNNCSTIQPVIETERTVYYRERAAGMYAPLPYAISQVVIEIPYVFIQATYYTLIVYSMVHFEWKADKFFWFFYVSFFSFLYFTYYGMLTMSLAPNHQVGAILASSNYLLFSVFSGFFIPKPKIPKWWIWYYWICPLAWTVYGLIVTQYGDMEDTIKVPGMLPDPTIKEFVKHHYGYHSDFTGIVAVVLLAFSVSFALLYTVCIRAFNFQTR